MVSPEKNQDGRWRIPDFSAAPSMDGSSHLLPEDVTIISDFINTKFCLEFQRGYRFLEAKQ